MSEGILPDGCVPPMFPPVWFPPVEEEPDVGDLGVDVDWMTHSHQQLHAMATQGLDLPGANTVAAKWAEIGEALQELSQDLDRAVSASQQGWEGDAAELARATAAKLTAWAEDTGHRAYEASGCVSRQAEICARASNEMPEPIGVEQPPPPCGNPDLPQFWPAGTGGGTVAMSAGPPPNPFTGGGFGEATQLVEPPWSDQEQARARHEHAAEVMSQLQRESYEVYGSVPRFSSPAPDYRERPQPPDEDEGEKRPRDDSRPKESDPTTRAAGVGQPAAGVAGAPLGGDPAGLRDAGPRLGPGVQSGIGPAQPGASNTPATPGQASAPAASAGPRGAGMGAMPMGMGAGAGAKGNDQERKAPGYLSGDSDLFGPDENRTGPVIGEGPDDHPPRR